ncbi:MAG: helix-turn-helix transcriptional regulator, partial [Planktomarina sp.]
ILLFRAKQREEVMHGKLVQASSRFQEVIELQFVEWGFSATESEIGILLIKGLSIAEIAEIRNRSQATIKAQNTSIYNKSGMANRAQLVSYFVEELTSGF